MLSEVNPRIDSVRLARSAVKRPSETVEDRVVPSGGPAPPRPDGPRDPVAPVQEPARVHREIRSPKEREDSGGSPPPHYEFRPPDPPKDLSQPVYYDTDAEEEPRAAEQLPAVYERHGLAPAPEVLGENLDRIV